MNTDDVCKLKRVKLTRQRKLRAAWQFVRHWTRPGCTCEPNDLPFPLHLLIDLLVQIDPIVRPLIVVTG